MELKNRTLSNFAELVRTGECKKVRGRLKVGVDLGTANTVLAVVDSTNRPIAGVSAPSHAIRDGVIVNYYESVQLVTKLKEELEEIQRQFFEIQRQLVKLQEEYQSLPGFSGLQAALEKEKEWGGKFEKLSAKTFFGSFGDTVSCSGSLCGKGNSGVYFREQGKERRGEKMCGAGCGTRRG